jgi:D-aminopeptidase
MIRNLFAAAVVAVLGGVVVAGDLKSGPQAGDKVPGAFHPYNVNGENAGKTACLYCAAGDSPVAVVFARTGDDAMTHKLIKALDAETVKNAKAEMFSFAVFQGDKTKLEPQLKDAAKKSELKKLVLAIEDNEDPIPAKYNLNKDADVTVLLYVDRVVKANYSFAKGKLTDKDIENVVKDVSKIVN